MNVSEEGKLGGRMKSADSTHFANAYELGSQALSLLYWTGSLAAALPLLVFAYLGTFSRYRADDYCETSRLLTSINSLQASAIRYGEWTGRYSTLLFVQLSEWFGRAGMIYMAGAALLLWLAGLTWLIAEIGIARGLRWNGVISFALAALVIFFSLYRAPNLFQVLFWRSGMVSYLVPLVVLVFTAAFFLYRLRVPLRGFRQLASYFLTFAGVFIAGGASETIAALEIGLLLLSMLAMYVWQGSIRKEVLTLLSVALLSALLSMLVMLLSPGNLVRMQSSTLPVPNLLSLGMQSLTYALQFIGNSFKVAPLPSFLAFLMPFLILYSLPNRRPSSGATGNLRWLMVLIPAGLVMAIAIGFAPSAYAQSFPSARVRFPALFLLTLGLAAEGGLSAYWLSQRTSPVSSLLVRALVLGTLLLTFLYPVRAATMFYDQVPAYRAQAADWDARDAQIRQAVEQGATDLVVIQLDTPGDVQEYKVDPNFWVNRCAAAFYGLRSLRAP